MMTGIALQRLPEAWIAKARELDPYAPAAAAAYRQAAVDLQLQLNSSEDSVTLREAREIGGYSIDHLQRLVKSGTIPNVGKVRRPRIRRADVPIKPGHAALRTKSAPRQLGASAVVTSAIEGAKR